MKKVLLTLVLIMSSWGACAQDQAPQETPQAQPVVQAPTQTPPAASGVSPLVSEAKQAIIIEAATNNVLYAKNADERMPTSSMSKVLTLYLVFDAIKKGKFDLNTTVTVSENAWRQTGSRTFMNIGQKVRIEDLIRGVIVQSGNDASVALAEAVAGGEGSFAELMNTKAAELGMTNSHFMNATGMPDPEHYSTARDLATLAQAMIRDYPEYYHIFSEIDFTFNNIKQGNRNPLLYRNMGADGIKTGHTDAGGFGLVASTLRDGRRILVVVNGLSDMQKRADEPAKLFEWAYREYGLYSFVSAKDKVGDVRVWLGERTLVPVAAEKDVVLSLPRSMKDSVKANATLNTETEAPIHKGQMLGKIVVTGNGIDTVEVPLLATEDVARLNVFKATWAKIKRAIGKEP